MPFDTQRHDVTIIDGKAQAARLCDTVTAQVRTLAEQHAIQPGLAVVLVGEDPASQTYVRSKHKRTVATGMTSFEHNLPVTTSEDELLELIHALNADTHVQGILVQLPLPEQINSSAVLAAIDPDKDVDGFHVINTGRMWNGQPALMPCTPTGCVVLLKQTLASLDGLHAVIVGRSNIVGKPLASMLLHENCTVTLAHSHTRDLPGLCRQADILIAAVGRPRMIDADWVKPGATVIDVGINRITDATSGKRRLVGDVDFDAVSAKAAAITPVPGGVGPMTIACLLQNTVMATCLQYNIAIDSLPRTVTT